MRLTTLSLQGVPGIKDIQPTDITSKLGQWNLLVLKTQFGTEQRNSVEVILQDTLQTFPFSPVSSDLQDITSALTTGTPGLTTTKTTKSLPAPRPSLNKILGPHPSRLYTSHPRANQSLQLSQLAATRTPKTTHPEPTAN